MSHPDNNHESVSISIDVDIIEAVDALARRTTRNRSQVFELAVKRYLASEIIEKDLDALPILLNLAHSPNNRKI